MTRHLRGVGEHMTAQSPAAAAAAEELERVARRPLIPCRRELRELAARFRAIDDADRVTRDVVDHGQLELGEAA